MSLQQYLVTGQFPSLIDQFGNMHRRNNEYVNSVAQNEHVSRCKFLV